MLNLALAEFTVTVIVPPTLLNLMLIPNKAKDGVGNVIVWLAVGATGYISKYGDVTVKFPTRKLERAFKYWFLMIGVNKNVLVPPIVSVAFNRLSTYSVVAIFVETSFVAGVVVPTQSNIPVLEMEATTPASSS